MRSRLVGPIGALAVGLVLAGCGGSDPPPTPPTPSSPAVSGPTAGPSASPTGSAGPTGSAPATPTAAPRTTSPALEPRTPVPPSATGGVDQTVAPRPVETKPPVELDETAAPRAGVQVRLAAVRRVTATAQLPGEVSGPALAVTLAVANITGAPVRLTDVVVNLDDASGAPANPVSTAPARALPTQLAPGRRAEGVFVFTVARARQGTVTVSVSLDPDQPVLVFRGRVR